MDAKILNAFSYKIAREDHTLGNLLRMCVTGLGRRGLRACDDAVVRGSVVFVGVVWSAVATALWEAVTDLLPRFITRHLSAHPRRPRRGRTRHTRRSTHRTREAHSTSPPPPTIHPRRRIAAPRRRRELLRDPHVKFAGYKHPHPLDNDIIVRVQTAPGLHPTQALKQASKRLEDEYRVMASAFDRDVNLLKLQKDM